MQFFNMCIHERYARTNRQKGVQLVELMIAVALIAVFIVPMSELLYSMRLSFFSSKTIGFSRPEWQDKFLSLTDSQLFGISAQFSLKDVQGKKSCRHFNGLDAKLSVPAFEGKSLSESLSTSSLPTSIAALGQYLIVGANSSSTTDPDVFSIHINKEQDDKLSMAASVDTGPGVADIFLSGYTAYVADTGVHDQAKAINFYNPEAPIIGRAYTFPGSNSVTSPISKRLVANGQFLFIGTEKSPLPEIEVFNISSGSVIGSIDTDFGINRLFVGSSTLAVLGPVDPEVNVYDISGLSITGPQVSIPKIYSYDAPGGSGNGRSIDVSGNQVFFGRTKGGSELSILESLRSMQSVFYSQKISASIDNIISDERQILVFTSDPARELMVYAPLQNDAGDIVSLSKTAEYDLPARTADAVCVGDKLYVALQSQITPLLVLGPKTL